MKIYNHLAKLREERNLTQKELAEKLGVLAQTINVIEKGTFEPGVIFTVQLAEVLKVDIKEIFPYKYKAR